MKRLVQRRRPEQLGEGEGSEGGHREKHSTTGLMTTSSILERLRRCAASFSVRRCSSLGPPSCKAPWEGGRGVGCFTSRGGADLERGELCVGEEVSRVTLLVRREHVKKLLQVRAGARGGSVALHHITETRFALGSVVASRLHRSTLVIARARWSPPPPLSY